MRRLVQLLASMLLAALLGAGCSEDSGAAPTIGDLTLQTTSVVVGQQATVSGQFTFSDPDGDVESFSVTVTAPTGASQTVGPQAIQNAEGVTDGPVSLAVVFNPGVAGDYGLEVWVTDSAGNDSNRLTGTVTAQ
jgi:ABC-type amino acid transport substrate-binding protein